MTKGGKVTYHPRIPMSAPITATVPAGFSAEMASGVIELPPPAGIHARNWGAALHDIATGQHHRLEANLLLFRPQNEGAWHALICMDYCLAREPDNLEAFREAWAGELGTSEKNVWIALSHTHASVAIGPSQVNLPGGEWIPPYREQIRERVGAALRELSSRPFRGELTWESGHCTLAKNRDYRVPGENRFACGYNPGAPADTTLLVGRLCDEAGSVRAVMVNYACHPTTLAWQNTLISPDYVGALRETVRARYPELPVCFLQGASGELAPRRQYTGELAIADANGRCVGYAALSVLEGMLPPWSGLRWAGVVESGAPLGIWESVAHQPPGEIRSGRFSVTIPFKPAAPLEELEARLARCEDRALQERLRRQIIRIRHQGESRSVDADIWWWTLGNTLWVAQGSECYSEFQTELRAAFPEWTVIVVTLANAISLTYFYPEAMAEADAYEVWVSALGADCLSRLKAGTVSGLREALA